MSETINLRLRQIMIIENGLDKSGISELEKSLKERGEAANI